MVTSECQQLESGKRLLGAPPAESGAHRASWQRVSSIMAASLEDPEIGLRLGGITEEYEDLDSYLAGESRHRSEDEVFEQFLALGDRVDALLRHAGDLRDAAVP